MPPDTTSERELSTHRKAAVTLAKLAMPMEFYASRSQGDVESSGESGTAGSDGAVIRETNGTPARS
jgi:hypothetical protein